VRDLDQPVARLLDTLPARDRPQRPHEGRLDHVLGVRLRPQDEHGVAQHLVRVTAVEAIDLRPGVATPEPEEPCLTRDDDHCLEKTRW
jgi:hypothetical protein